MYLIISYYRIVSYYLSTYLIFSSLVLSSLTLSYLSIFLYIYLILSYLILSYYPTIYLLIYLSTYLLITGTALPSRCLRSFSRIVLRHDAGFGLPTGPNARPRAGQQKAKLLIHEDANQLLSHLDQQLLGWNIKEVNLP